MKILTKIPGTLDEDVTTFVTSRRILIKIKNVSDKICRENQNIHFMFGKPTHLPNIVPYEMWKNIVQPDKSQITI